MWRQGQSKCEKSRIGSLFGICFAIIFNLQRLFITRYELLQCIILIYGFPSKIFHCVVILHLIVHVLEVCWQNFSNRFFVSDTLNRTPPHGKNSTMKYFVFDRLKIKKKFENNLFIMYLFYID